MEINQIIATNLKNLRLERNLSLGQLANLCDVSKVMLSQIEKGDSNPTINTIWKIANGLKVPYSSLLEQPAQQTSIVQKAQLTPQVDDQDHYRIYCFYPNTPHRNFELFQIELDSNHRHESAGHGENTQEFIMVIEGELTLEVANQIHTIKKDEAINFDAANAHSYKASSKEMVKAVLINFYPA
ncbi:MAG: XRE family transcriptional regulator [Erysipelotrichaceae bacterium]|nr:XRE family transcriptional regulator [Erysipelotrichaceae bacterium]